MNPLAILSGLNQAAVQGIAIAVAVVGLILATYFHGRHVTEGEAAAARLEIALDYAAEIIRQQDVAADLASENAALRAARLTRERVITKEVTRYVQVTPPALRCVLPGTWRLRHDLAAADDTAVAAAGSLDAASADPVEDAAALETIADNYAACNDAMAKLDAWQRRYQRLEVGERK